MDALMDRAVGQRRLSMTLLGTFAALAMVLAALGIYGVMAFWMSRGGRGDRRPAWRWARRGAACFGLVLRQGLALAASGRRPVDSWERCW